MIIDYFLYNDDPELLLFRYNYLKPLTHGFVICEANYTWTGIPKSYTVESVLVKHNISTENILILKVDLSEEKLKITTEDITCAKALGSTDFEVIKYFTRRRIQRDCILEILDKFNDDLLFLISDIDEILNRDKFELLKDVLTKYPDHALKVPLVFLEHSADKRLITMDNDNVLYQDSLTLCTKSHLKLCTPNNLRNKTTNFPCIKINVDEVNDGYYGWLFHNMGNNDKVQYKKNCSINYYFPNLNIESSSNQRNFKLGDYNEKDLPYLIWHYPIVKSLLLPNSKPTKVILNLLYNGEAELLKLHYKLFADKVDLIVLYHGNRSFNGLHMDHALSEIYDNDKGFYYNNNLDKRKVRYEYIIYPDIYLPSLNGESSIHKDNLPEVTQSIKFFDSNLFKLLDENDLSKPYSKDDIRTQIIWLREKFIRNRLNAIIEDFCEDSVFICSDLDEVLDMKHLKNVLNTHENNRNKILKIPLVHLELRTDRRLCNDDGSFVQWDKSMFLCSKDVLRKNTVTHIIDEYNLKNEIIYHTENGSVVEDLGWHLCWVLGTTFGEDPEQKVRAKALSLSYNKNIKYNYPMSLVLVKFLQSLLGTSSLYTNIKNKVSVYDDSRFLDYIEDDEQLLRYFTHRGLTYNQCLSFYKLKYEKIYNNSDNLIKTYKFLYSLLPSQNKVVDFSCNLGIALKVAFNLWMCEVYGYESASILDSRFLFGMTEDYKINWTLNYAKLKGTFLMDGYMMETFPIHLQQRFEMLTPVNECSLAICNDFAQYLPEDVGKRLVKSLTESSNLILFSSANPTEFEITHKNSQWPSYWINEFNKYGYEAYEIRDKLADLDYVPNHLKMNLLILSKENYGTKVSKPNLIFDSFQKLIELPK
jgi:hypothetical protein